MKIERFEDIVVWQKARELTTLVYFAFKANTDYRFKDQIQAAAVSVMNNIAEGFERKGNKDFSRFLYIAKGSCGEVRSMLYLSLELGYLSKEDFNKAYQLAEDTSKMLAGFIKTLKTN